MEEKNILTNKNNNRLYSFKEENKLKLNKLLNDNEFLENNNYILRLLKKSEMLPEKFDLLLREKTPLIINNKKNEKKYLINEKKEDNSTIGYTKNKTQITYELDDLLYNHSKSFSKSKKRYYKIKKENDEFLYFYHFNKNMKPNILNMDRNLISSAKKKKIKKIFEEKTKIYDVINSDNYLLMNNENDIYYHFLYKSGNERKLYTQQNPYKYIAKIRRYLKNKTFDKKEDSSSEQKSQDDIYNNNSIHKNKGHNKRYNKTETTFYIKNKKVKINNKLNIDNSLKKNLDEKILKNKVNNYFKINQNNNDYKKSIKKIIDLSKDNPNNKKNLNNYMEENFKGNNKLYSDFNKNKQNILINNINGKNNNINKNNNDNINNNIHNVNNKGININKNNKNNSVDFIKKKPKLAYINEKSNNIINSNFKSKNSNKNNLFPKTFKNEKNLLTEQNNSIIINKEKENIKNNKEELKENISLEKENNRSNNLRRELKSYIKNNTSKTINNDNFLNNINISENKFKSDNKQKDSSKKINNIYKKKLSSSNMEEYYSNLNQNKTITKKYSSKSNNSELIDSKNNNIKAYNNENKQNIFKDANLINNNCNKYTIDSSQKILIKDENSFKRKNKFNFTNIKKNSINSNKRKTIFGLYEEQKNKLNKRYRQNNFKLNTTKRKTYDQLIFYDLDLFSKKKIKNKSSFITGTNNYSNIINKKYIINYYKGQNLDSLITDIKMKNANNKWYKFLRNELIQKDQINRMESKNQYLNNLDKYFIKKFSEFQVLISYADDNFKDN